MTRSMTWTLVAAVGLVLGIFGGNGIGAEDHPHNEHFATCAKTCADCMNSCASCYQHCAALVAAGKNDHEKTMKLCNDCAELCGVAAKLAARQSTLSALACEACAKACDQCATACEKFPDDKHMAACAKSCRDCARECREMIKHVAN